MNVRMGLLGISAAVLSGAFPASAVGQVNDFEDGTTQGWQTNLLGSGGAPQPVVQSGGAGGPSDDYLLVASSGGSGPGSRLNIINPTGWSGNYLSNGVTGFSARLINLGSSDLYLRILFEDPAPMSPPTNIAYSGDAFFLPVGSGWTDAFFSTSAADLVIGIGTVESALANTTTIRLYHSFADAAPGAGAGISPVNGRLGLDDFRAIGSIPEPSTWATILLGFGAIGAGLRSRRGQRKPTVAAT